MTSNLLTKKNLQGVLLLAIIAGVGFSYAKHKKQEQSQGAMRMVVEMTDEGFQPREVNIQKGGTVTWVNKSSKPRWPASDLHPTHSVYAEFDPKQGIEPGQSWEFTFNNDGKWNYHDHLFPHKKGVVTVSSKAAQQGAEQAITETVSQLLAAKEPKKQAEIIRAYAEKYGPLEALHMIKQAGLPYTGETHLLVHEIGDVAFERYGKDALLYCDDSFLSACYHGVIINALGDQGLEGVVEMVDKCKSAGNRVLTQCSHAAGHGFLAWQSYQVLKTLPYCDQLHDLDNAIPAFNCYDGVFMENIFGVHEGKPSPNRMVKASDPFYPCNAVPEKYAGGCWSNQATLAYELYKGDLKKVANLCDQVKDIENQRTCYHNFARQIHPLTLGKIDKSLELCKNATGTVWQDKCLITLVEAAFSVGDTKQLPYELCDAMKDSPRQSECNNTLLGMISAYSKGQQDLAEMCGYIKADSLRTDCARRFGVEPAKSNPISLLDEVKNLAKTQGVQAAYDFVKSRWLSNPGPAHDLAHLVGILSYEMSGIAGLTTCDANFAFGCYHGFFQTLLEAEGDDATAQALSTCHALIASGMVASCVHGIGHGLMGSTDGIVEAIEKCQSFTDQDRDYCFDGSFMQYYADLPKEDFSLENLWDFCLSMAENSQGQCVRNHTFHILYSSTESAPQIIKSCYRLLQETIRGQCIHTTGLYAAQISSGVPDKAKAVCNKFSKSDDRSFCLTAVSKEFVFQGRDTTLAKNICNDLETQWKSRCLDELNITLKQYGKS